MKKANLAAVLTSAFAATLFAAVSGMAQQQAPAAGPPPVLVQQDWYRAVGASLQRAGAQIVVRGSRNGISGQFTPKVGFSVAADGTVANVRIAESSGNAAVDQLAVEIPALAAPLHPFTPDMTPGEKSLVAPLQLHFEAPQAGETTQQ